MIMEDAILKLSLKNENYGNIIDTELTENTIIPEATSIIWIDWK